MRTSFFALFFLIPAFAAGAITNETPTFEGESTSFSQSADVTHSGTNTAGTKLIGFAGLRENIGNNGSLTLAMDWNGDAMSLVGVAAESGTSSGDAWVAVYCLDNPDTGSHTLTYDWTGSGSTDVAWIGMMPIAGDAGNACGTDVTVKARHDDGAPDTDTDTDFAVAGTAGNGLIIVCNGVGGDRHPFTTPTDYTEVSSSSWNTGGAGNPSDLSGYVAVDWDDAPSGGVVTFTNSDELACIHIEIAAAAEATANVNLLSGKLGQKLKGKLQ